MEELGFEEKRSFRFWHKVGGTINEGRYLENDSDVLNQRNHIPINYEVKIYVQHLDDGNHEARDDEFDNNEYDFDENDGLLDAFVCDDIEPKGKMIVHGGEKTEDVIYNMQEDSEEDDGVKKYPLFDPKKDSEKPELKLGLVFNSKKEAKFAIESYCIREGIPVKCHSNCVRDLKNNCVNSTWLGNTFAKKFSTNPKLGHLEFKEEISVMFQSDFSRKTAYMAKRKALKLVQGSVEEQFRKIRMYCAELKRSDTGATVVLKLTEDDKGPRFQRLYVCYSVCKQGFKSACRRIIGVDGCFFKGGTWWTIVISRGARSE
ncbi:uncharacterized protein [Henckelia pumila]|uniref:uncharacterized protein n=1 Tax=Henckelia pumila TaxID=405737 RepID=UPI003C6E566F